MSSCIHSRLDSRHRQQAPVGKGYSSLSSKMVLPSSNPTCLVRPLRTFEQIDLSAPNAPNRTPGTQSHKLLSYGTRAGDGIRCACDFWRKVDLLYWPPCFVCFSPFFGGHGLDPPRPFMVGSSARRPLLSHDGAMVVMTLCGGTCDVGVLVGHDLGY